MKERASEREPSFIVSSLMCMLYAQMQLRRKVYSILHATLAKITARDIMCSSRLLIAQHRNAREERSDCHHLPQVSPLQCTSNSKGFQTLHFEMFVATCSNVCHRFPLIGSAGIQLLLKCGGSCSSLMNGSASLQELKQGPRGSTTKAKAQRFTSINARHCTDIAFWVCYVQITVDCIDIHLSQKAIVFVVIREHQVVHALVGCQHIAPWSILL